MKKILFTFIAVLSVIASYAQTVQGTIKVTGTNQITVYAKSSATFSAAIQNINLTISLPTANAAGVTASLGNQVTSMIWTAQPVDAASNGQTNYAFVGNNFLPFAGEEMSFVAGEEVAIAVITISGAASVGSMVQLNDLTSQNGGPSQQAYWYFQIVGAGDVTNYDERFYTTTASGIGTDSNGDQYAFTTAALPVTLVSFTAVKEGTTTQLEWVTTAETNSEAFDIQRSNNAKDWATIGTKAAAGESKDRLNYAFTDAATAAGINYYRLKMIDADKTFAYSSIKSVEFGAATLVSVYPNPASDIVFLTDAAGGALDAKNIKGISIVNANGVTVYKTTGSTIAGIPVAGIPVAGIPVAGIPVAGLTNGIYAIKVIRLDGKDSSHKLVIMR